MVIKWGVVKSEMWCWVYFLSGQENDNLVFLLCFSFAQYISSPKKEWLEAVFSSSALR